jgi:hypothetical protein
MQTNYEAEQLSMFGQDLWYGKMFPAPLVQERQRAKTSESFWRRSSALSAIPFQSLDLTPGAGNLLGEFYWELISPWRGGASTLNTGVSPKDAKESSLSQILQADPPLKYYLSPKACLGILRRAFERGKELPKKLDRALNIQAGLMRPDGQPTGLEAYHINQRDEGIDLHGVSGALLATTNMQMQTFVTQPDEAVEGFDGYNGDLTGDVAATLGVNCGMSTGRNGVMAFAANQRDEVRDLHDLAGALGAQPGMKQQTFVASGVVTKGNGDCFLSEERHTALTAGGGQAGQGYPCVLTAAFSAGQGSKAGGIGYQEECSPTLKATESGTNMVPSVLCLNDQGGSVMNCSENISGTLRAQEHGHQPLVYENHGIDSRYTGPHKVAPTMSARYGTGGNNVPLVEQEADAICIAGNIVDRQPQNGGNGLGCQDELAYTLTATDRHCIYARQRVDEFKDGKVVSTQSARQHKDATDLVVDVAGLDCRNAVENGDLCGTLQKGTSGSSLNSIHPIRNGLLIRRLTPLECERLQGFPDGWTDIPGASDSARYKALGNSVAIPCVEFIMSRIAAALL